MTEWKVPIKCSTVRNISNQCDRSIRTLMEIYILVSWIWITYLAMFYDHKPSPFPDYVMWIGFAGVMLSLVYVPIWGAPKLANSAGYIMDKVIGAIPTITCMKDEEDQE